MEASNHEEEEEEEEDYVRYTLKMGDSLWNKAKYKTPPRGYNSKSGDVW